MEYRVLTLWEPWATLVVHGIKKIETRLKPTSWTVEKGTYLIHTAKKWTMDQEKICTYNKYFRDELNKILPIIQIGHPYWKHYFEFGHIIGSVEVKECHEIFIDPLKDSYLHILNKTVAFYPTDTEIAFGDYTPGRYAWILQNPRILETPIPYKGQQGFYPRFKGDFDKL